MVEWVSGWDYVNNQPFLHPAAPFEPGGQWHATSARLENVERTSAPNDDEVDRAVKFIQCGLDHIAAFGGTVEWSALNAPHPLTPEIPVTPEMMKINTGHKPYTGPFLVTEERLFAGSNACLKSHPSPNEMAKAVYRTMAALVPVERSADHDRQVVRDRQLVPLAYHEEKIGCMRDNLELALDRERQARDEIAILRAGWDNATKGWNEAREQLADVTEKFERSHKLCGDMIVLLVARDARIAELDSCLAAFTANDTPSEPAHNPFQAFTGDPRRMGR